MSDRLPDPMPDAGPQPGWKDDVPEQPPGAAEPTTSRDERRLLQGPQKRGSELARLWRIGWEFMKGFRSLHFVGPCVTVFGSARFKDDHPYYALAREMGRRLAQSGFTVLTGGGPGVMEAANRGAREVQGRSIGCNIKLPKEQHPNPYLDHFLEFQYFFIRKVMLVKYSYAFVVLPGGFGTLDEVFETATLIQTGKIEDFPVVLMGVDYWRPLIDFMQHTMVEAGTIDPEDFDLLTITDDPALAVEQIRHVGLRKFGLTYGPRATNLPILGERRMYKGAAASPKA